MIVALALGLVPAHAHAQEGPAPVEPVEHEESFHGREIPEDSPAAEELQELARLSHEAGGLGEELHTARAEQEEAEAQAAEAHEAAEQAHHAAADGQTKVDSIAKMRYRGSGTDDGRAALLADSPEDLVDRLGYMRVLSGMHTDQLEAVQDQAVAADRRGVEAEEARALAIEKTLDLERRNEEMQARIQEVQARVDALEEEARAIWEGGPAIPDDLDVSTLTGGGDNAGALQAAISRIGAPYSWGATGPGSFDCSGLMVWSYAQIGKTLPRSSQMQAGAGTEVSRESMQPGDLIIYFPGATHVGMYAGDGRVLHASDYGVPVGFDPYDSMPIHSIRRY